MRRKRRFARTVQGRKLIYVTCRNPRCRWVWAPNPNLWRNHSNAVSGRSLKCSRCGYNNQLSVDGVRNIIKYNYL